MSDVPAPGRGSRPGSLPTARRSPGRRPRPSVATSTSRRRRARRSLQTDSSARSSNSISGTVPSGRMAPSSSSAACSVQMRSSRACHSMATRSRSRHCLMTIGGRPEMSTRSTTLETPPVSSRTCTSAVRGTRPESRKYSAVLTAVNSRIVPELYRRGTTAIKDRQRAGLLRSRYSSIGSSISTKSPGFAFLAVILPWCSSTARVVMARPRPTPPLVRPRSRSTR